MGGPRPHDHRRPWPRRGVRGAGRRGPDRQQWLGLSGVPTGPDHDRHRRVRGRRLRRCCSSCSGPSGQPARRSPHPGAVRGPDGGPGPGGPCRRRPRRHPGLQRGRDLAGDARSDPGDRRGTVDPGPGRRRCIAGCDAGRWPWPMAPTSSVSRSMAAGAPHSRRAISWPSGSGSTSWSRSTRTASTSRPRWNGW